MEFAINLGGSGADEFSGDRSFAVPSGHSAA